MTNSGFRYEELTERIIGCAYEVFNTLGSGYLETIYEAAMLIELEEAGLRSERQVPAMVEYRGRMIGEFYADIVIEDLIVVELKAVSTIARAHELQLVNYLTVLNKDVGLILNFAESKVEIKRKVRHLSQINK